MSCGTETRCRWREKEATLARRLQGKFGHGYNILWLSTAIAPDIEAPREAARRVREDHRPGVYGFHDPYGG